MLEFLAYKMHATAIVSFLHSRLIEPQVHTKHRCRGLMGNGTLRAIAAASAAASAVASGASAAPLAFLDPSFKPSGGLSTGSGSEASGVSAGSSQARAAVFPMILHSTAHECGIWHPFPPVLTDALEAVEGTLLRWHK